MQLINRIILTSVFFIISVFSFGQKNYTISGFIKDKSNGEAMPGVAIFNSEKEADFEYYLQECRNTIKEND